MKSVRFKGKLVHFNAKFLLLALPVFSYTSAESVDLSDSCCSIDMEMQDVSESSDDVMLSNDVKDSDIADVSNADAEKNNSEEKVEGNLAGNSSNVRDAGVSSNQSPLLSPAQIASINDADMYGEEEVDLKSDNNSLDYHPDERVRRAYRQFMNKERCFGFYFTRQLL